jgi:hypothetical protein
VDHFNGGGSSGETVAVDPTVPDSYTFVMDAATHRFAWTY